MLNGLCLELRFTGDLQIKPASQFDLYTNCIQNNEKAPVIHRSPTPSELITVEKNDTLDFAEMNFDLSARLHKPTDQPIEDVKKRAKLSPTELLSKHARIQLHELLSDTACIFEIEPMESLEEKYSERSNIKLQYLSELINKPTPKDPVDQNKDERNDKVKKFVGDSTFGYEQANETLENYETLDNISTENKSVEDQPLSPTIINQDLSNRFETMIENSEIRKSSEFIRKIHDLYHVGTVEIWLVPPYDMPQLEGKEDEEPQEIQPETPVNVRVSTSKPDLRSISSSRPYTNKEFTSSTPSMARSKSSFPHTRESKGLSDYNVLSYQNQRSHHIIRLNTVHGIEIATDKSPSGMIMEDFPSDLKSPLATYDIMIDPDIVSNYLRIMSNESKSLNNMEIANDALEESAKINPSVIPKQFDKIQRNLKSSVQRKLSNSAPNKRGIISARSLNTKVPNLGVLTLDDFLAALPETTFGGIAPNDDDDKNVTQIELLS
ncbi:unnamed protein product [Schistosoma turkestanicum]|nr:unnamed protein product [Schistosoma turkestanicum]